MTCNYHCNMILSISKLDLAVVKVCILESTYIALHVNGAAWVQRIVTLEYNFALVNHKVRRWQCHLNVKQVEILS